MMPTPESLGHGQSSGAASDRAMGISGNAQTTKPAQPFEDGQPLSRERRQRTLSRAEEREYTLKVRPWRRNVTSAERLISKSYKGKGTEQEPFIVEWLHGETENPQNFSNLYKWAIVAHAAVSTLIVSLSSSAYSGAIDSMMQQTGKSEEVILLGIFLFVLGFALGPLLWAPLSEVLGRRHLFIATFIAFTIFNALGAAASNIQSILIFRFLAGSFGSSPLTNSGGIISDVFDARKRGLGLSIFAMAPFQGPALGPIIGGFIAEASNYRYVQLFLALSAGLCTVVGALFIPETYAPCLLRQRAAWLSAYTGKEYRAPVDAHGKIKLKSLFKTALARPWMLLFYEPIVLLITLYMSVVYGTLYMLFGAFPYVYQELRRWSIGVSGLAFLGVLVGMICATSYAIFVVNPRYLRVADRHDGLTPPEERLPPGIVGSVALVVGLTWFSATCQPSVFWLVSIMAGAPFGFGMVLIFLACFNYLVDAYTLYASSVLAANSVMRSIFGAVFPLFVLPMYRNLGVNWASAIPTFLAAACLPFLPIFARYGHKIRVHCKFAAEAQRQLDEMQASQKRGRDPDHFDEDDLEDSVSPTAMQPAAGVLVEIKEDEKTDSGALGPAVNK